MDRASQVLAQSLPVDVPRTYAALSEWGNVAISTLHHRDTGRRSREALAQSQQYLTPDEEKALVKFLLLMSSLGQPVRIKFIPSLAFSIARNRSTNSAAQALLQDQNRFLSKINDEEKVRRSTRSVVLGKAKVMSFEDLEQARAKRAAKEKAITGKGKGKRDRKRKSPAIDEGSSEAEAGSSVPKEKKVARVSEVKSPGGHQ